MLGSVKTVNPKHELCTATALAGRCHAAGWELTPDQADKLAVYLGLLMRWNAAMNLVGTHSWTATLDHLVFDSFELARFLSNDAQPESLARAGDSHATCLHTWDLGAGAGLPGIPLRIVWPHGKYWLVEAREKRALFLSTVLARISLPGTHVFRGRAEAFMPGRQADCILSRAFMPWPDVLRLAHPHLAPGGQVILLTKEPIETKHMNVASPDADWRIHASICYQVGADTRRLYALTLERNISC